MDGYLVVLVQRAELVGDIELSFSVPWSPVYHNKQPAFLEI